MVGHGDSDSNYTQNEDELNHTSQQINIAVSGDYEKMMTNFRVLTEKEESNPNYIEEEETSINSDFDDHLERLIEKLSMNHTTFFNEPPPEEEPLEEDKFKTSRLK